MGYSTEYLGSLRIDPPLNPHETAWLRAYRRSLRCLQTDPYQLPMNPGVIPDDHPLVEKNGIGYAVQAGSQSGGPSPCDWQPGPHGRRLYWERREKSNNAIPTLEFLIDHFLRPGAHARMDGREDFRAFTFDHVVSGIIAAERGDGELSLIVVEANEVSQAVLVPGAGLW